MATLKKMISDSEKTLVRIGKERDRIENLISELECRRDNTEAAEFSLQDAIVALHVAAEELSKEI